MIIIKCEINNVKKKRSLKCTVIVIKAQSRPIHMKLYFQNVYFLSMLFNSTLETLIYLLSECI